MDDDSEHKVDDSDDGWVLYSEWIREEESDIVPESDGHTAMLTVEMWAFLSGFSCRHPYAVPLSPNITWARGSYSHGITWYETGEIDTDQA